MRVILVNPPIRLPLAFAHYPMSSTLGLLTNAAWLRVQGHDVRVVDAFTLADRLRIRPDGDQGFRHVGAEVEQVADAVRDAAGRSSEQPCVVVSVTMFSDMNRAHENLVPRTAAALRRALPDASVGLADLHVCGMNYFPFDPVRALSSIPEADWVLLGEAEPTLPELVRRLGSGDPIAGLPMLAWRDPDGSIGFDPAAPVPIGDLDVLPLPAFDLLDMERYFAVLGDAIEADLVHEYHVVERQLPLMTSRGCPFRCCFCTNQVLGLPWRACSVEYVRRAVRELRERYRVDRFLLLDDNINVDAARFRALVRMLAEEGVPWDAVNGYRADRLDLEMVRAIKAAGNTKITVSAESGDPEVLRRTIRKGLKLSSVIKLAKLCQDERVPLQVHYILGVPGETKAQVNRTLEFATELLERHGAWPLIQHAIPFPGTRLYQQCEEHGWFVAPPERISGAVLEVESIIATPDLGPGEVIEMKLAAQKLHAAIQTLSCIEVETACDCDCWHCSSGARTGDRPTSTDLRERIAWARFLGGREAVLAGGEPTLRPDLPDVITEARSLGFERVTLATNAHGLVDEERARRIVEAGVDRIVVDLLGPRPAAHDAVARTHGAFRWTLAGVRRAQALGCRDLEVNVPITRISLEHLPATVALAMKLGARGVHLVLPQPDTPAFSMGEVPSWAEAEPFVLAALDMAPGRVTVQGAPLCLWPDRPRALVPLPHWVLRRARSSRAKLARCLECTRALLCGGFFRPEHEEIYRVLDSADRAARSSPSSRTRRTSRSSHEQGPAGAVHPGRRRRDSE